MEPGRSTGSSECKFKNFRKTTTCSDTGAKYEWCKLRGRKNDKGVQSGTYIPQPHNHKEWEARRSKYNADWKEKKQAKKNRKSETYAANLPKKSADMNFSLAKSFKYSLATQLMFSYQEANQLVYKVLNGNFAEDDELKE